MMEKSAELKDYFMPVLLRYMAAKDHELFS